ncbi:MAG: DUF4129 domain-containing protein [Thermoplasmata archaeon]
MMGRAQGFSPTLLIVGAIAALGGSAAALLGVGAPSVAAAPSNVSLTLPVSVPLEAILAVPLVVLVVVVLWSLLSTGGTAITARGAITAIVVVAIVLFGIVWVLHLAPEPVLYKYGGVPGSGAGGRGGTTGTGAGGPGGTGAGSGTGNGSNGTGHHGGAGSGGGKNGTTNGSGPGGNHTGGNGTNRSGNGTGHSGSGNGSSGGGRNGTGSTGRGGGSGGNRSIVAAAPPAPPPYAVWPVYAAAMGASVLLVAIVLPELASRWANRRRPSDVPSQPPVRIGAAQVFAEAAKRLARPASDPRGVILELYSQLLARLEPRFEIPLYRTPEEIRSVHLVPLGVRAEVAHHLTRLFEEACYSSHPLGEEAVRLAQSSVQIAEYDLRAAHAIG